MKTLTNTVCALEGTKEGWWGVRGQEGWWGVRGQAAGKVGGEEEMFFVCSAHLSP